MPMGFDFVPPATAAAAGLTDGLIGLATTHKRWQTAYRFTEAIGGGFLSWFGFDAVGTTLLVTGLYALAAETPGALKDATAPKSGSGSAYTARVPGCSSCGQQAEGFIGPALSGAAAGVSGEAVRRMLPLAGGYSAHVPPSDAGIQG